MYTIDINRFQPLPPNRQDLTGKRFGRVTVLGYMGLDAHRNPRWEWKCDCGTIRTSQMHAFKKGSQKSCGCFKKDGLHNFGKGVDLTGRVFGRWTVIQEAPRRQVGKKTVITVRAWLCQCECGTQRVKIHSDLRSGNAKSCGCIQLTHGRANHPLYSTWHNMIKRCFLPTDKLYPRYGGRGITVCERWHDIENFLADMGERPSGEYSLERVDNNGNYCPENCTWATRNEQCNNKSNNHLLTLDGKTQTLTQWSKEVNFTTDTLRRRIKKGWTPEQVLRTPAFALKPV